VLTLQVNLKDLFQTTKTIPNTLKHLMSREFDEEFRHYLVDVDCKCALSWWWT
jgi:hypothetical protein